MNLRFYSVLDYNQLKELLELCGLFVECADTFDLYEKKIEHDAESILLLVEDGCIVGSIFIVYDPWMASVYRLCVHPDYRGRGYGTRLLAEAENVLKLRGVKSCGLYVSHTNKNKEFYEKQGWHVFDEYTCLEKLF